MTAFVAQAGPVLTTGTPGDANLATPSGPSIVLGNLINFDSTSSCTSSPCPSLALGNATFSSPDTLSVIPYSTQSYPNELYDNGTSGTQDGVANLTIKLNGGTTAIAVGIADSDAVTVYVQALNSAGAVFGTQFALTIPENTVNPGNGYYEISDTTPDIYGLLITQPVSSLGNYSGLAIDDVQSTPEPSSYLLLTSGAALLFALRKRKRA